MPFRHVRSGDTLVFKVPVSVANTRFSITGGGDVIFEGGFSSTKVNTQGCVRDGTCVVICSMAGENGQLALFAVTSAAAPRMSKIRIEANGTLNQYVYWPTCSANDPTGAVSVGGTCEILTGGRLNLLATDKDNQMFAYKGTETVVLDGGTVSMLTATTYKGGTGVLDFRSGAVEVGGDLSTVIFPREIPLQIGGEVTFDVESDAGAAVAQIAAPITGAGTFVKAGAATLALTGVQTGLSGGGKHACVRRDGRDRTGRRPRDCRGRDCRARLHRLEGHPDAPSQGQGQEGGRLFERELSVHHRRRHADRHRQLGAWLDADRPLRRRSRHVRQVRGPSHRVDAKMFSSVHHCPPVFTNAIIALAHW